MQLYHFSFPVRHSGEHIVIALALIGIPLLLLSTFSFASGIALNVLVGDIGISLWRLAIAFAIAAVLGWCIAAFLTHGRLGELSLPLFDVLQSMPSFALLPLFMGYFGAGNVTVIFFLILAVIWPIVFTTVSAIKQSDRDLNNVITMSRVQGLDYFRYYLLPLSLPGFVTGLIIGIGEGWEALIATEIIVNVKNGAGAFFTAVAGSPILTAFGILIFLSIIFVLNKLLWLPLLGWSHRLAN